MEKNKEIIIEWQAIVNELSKEIGALKTDLTIERLRNRRLLSELTKLKGTVEEKSENK